MIPRSRILQIIKRLIAISSFMAEALCNIGDDSSLIFTAAMLTSEFLSKHDAPPRTIAAPFDSLYQAVALTSGSGFVDLWDSLYVPSWSQDVAGMMQNIQNIDLTASTASGAVQLRGTVLSVVLTQSDD